MNFQDHQNLIRQAMGAQFVTIDRVAKIPEDRKVIKERWHV